MIKNYDTCKRCYYGSSNPGCRDCDDCSMCDNCDRDTYDYTCKCNQLDDGDDCPYFVEYKEEDNETEELDD